MSDAEFVKQTRKKLGLNQVDFAELLGVSERSIKRLEAGEQLELVEERTLATLNSLADKITEIMGKKK